MTSATELPSLLGHSVGATKLNEAKGVMLVFSHCHSHYPASDQPGCVVAHVRSDHVQMPYYSTVRYGTVR